jgi:2'-5' RNA ligase
METDGQSSEFVFKHPKNGKNKIDVEALLMHQQTGRRCIDTTEFAPHCTMIRAPNASSIYRQDLFQGKVVRISGSQQSAS